MKIGTQTQRTSAISASNADAIVVRGRNLCTELVGVVTFTEHTWLLVAGELPSAAQCRILDATLVAIAEHGLVPSVAASRMTLAAAPEALQGAVAAGILGCGSVILGAADAAGRLFTTILARAANEPLEAAARAASEGRCYREMPVTLRAESGALVEGFVDLAFEDEEGFVVVDFKTDRELDGALDRYQRQVSIYAVAIAAATGRSARAVLMRV